MHFLLRPSFFVGILLFILQFLLADAFSLFLCFFDVIALISHKWIFGQNMCSIFILISNLSATATIYLTLTTNLHAISVANLALNMTYVIKSKEEKSEFLSEEFESCSGDYDTLEHKRTLTIDYSSGSRFKTSVNVSVPSLIVWLIAFLVSMPSFLFSITTMDHLRLKCFPKKFSHELKSIVGLSEIFLISLRTLVPVSLIILFLIIATKKFNKLRKIDESLIDENPQNILKFVKTLSAIFLTFQVPKICIDAILLFYRDLNLELVRVAISLVYYFGIVLRLACIRFSIKKI